MTVIDLRNFAGEIPKTGPSALAPDQAQRATNCRLVSGEVRPYGSPVMVYQPANEPLTIYRGSNGQQSKWYTWTTDVNICESPIADTTDYRVYYTGDSVPKKTNWAMATNGAGPYPNPSTGWLNMGVPAPTGALTLSATGTGSGTVVSRAYVYTYLSTFGSLVEESAPSPATLVNWQTGQSINCSGFTAPPTSNYNITGINLYRTVTGTTGAEYELVAQLTLAQTVGTTYVDSILDANVIGTVLQTLTWTPPPSNMIGLIDMGYGMLAGFVGNTLYICVPYYPHAWPLQQTLTFPANIIGLGMMGSSLIVCTDQNPFIVSGTAPSNLTQEPISIHEPCVSKRSVISNLTGVMYASPNGLVGISELIQGTITDSLIEREAWQNFNPTTMMGVVYDGRYGGFFTLPTGGDLIDGGGTDLGGMGFFLDKADEPVRALYAHMDASDVHEFLRALRVSGPAHRQPVRGQRTGLQHLPAGRQPRVRHDDRLEVQALPVLVTGQHGCDSGRRGLSGPEHRGLHQPVQRCRDGQQHDLRGRLGDHRGRTRPADDGGVHPDGFEHGAPAAGGGAADLSGLRVRGRQPDHEFLAAGQRAGAPTQRLPRAGVGGRGRC
jgi:hypothetical protein